MKWYVLWLLIVVGGVITVVSMIGCQSTSKELVTPYGINNYPFGSEENVNGTVVFNRLFVEEGHSVRSSNRLSPSTARRDVIVWFPRDFDDPSEDAEIWVEDWLLTEPNRTLIYVGRDYDSAPSYWDAVANRPMDPRVRKEVGRKAVAERIRVNNERGALPAVPKAKNADKHPWFQRVANGPTREVRSLEGDSAWTAGVDPKKLGIELKSKILPPASGPFGGEVEVLLSSEGDPLVWRVPYGESQVIVVANGSFLLNFPLVNHEHRKLAGSLIDEVGPDKYVTFLEAGSSPPISDKDPEFKLPTGLEYLNTPPVNYVLWHLALAAVIFGFARSPIFGLPRVTERTHYSDFGKHVAALGELLSKSGDAEFARAQIKHFHENASLESQGLRRATPTRTSTSPYDEPQP